MASKKSVYQKARVHKVHQHYQGALFSFSDEKIHVFLARGLKRSEQKLDKDEIIDIVKYPFEETLELIEQGQISDALTILSLQRAWFYLRK